MTKFIEYAPIIIVVMGFFIAYKVFVTPEQLSALKSQLIEYISEHYVAERTYRDNHISLENRIDRIDKNISDVKTLLISVVQNQNYGNINN